ncbi:MAG: TfoX/Sxy family protein [Burkholderiales bacterium]|nr:MAG: TfoX/Sxy family protein [Burkholderiales bacterium]
MAYDEGVAQRLREAFAGRGDVVEKRMFGGIAFMVSGHMCCGVIGDALMARVGPERHAAVLERPHAREMDFTGRPMTGFVYVAPAGFESDRDLDSWVQTCLDFVESLPPR